MLGAAAFGAHIAALSCEMHVQVPGHFMSGSVVGLPGIDAATLWEPEPAKPYLWELH